MAARLRKRRVEGTIPRVRRSVSSTLPSAACTLRITARSCRNRAYAGNPSGIFEGLLGGLADSWHNVPMKREAWIRKLCLGSCVNAKELDNIDGLRIGTEALSSRATIAEAVGGSATGAVAIGALAIGGFAIGCLVIGRLLIRQLLIQRVHLRYLKIDQLEVENLRVSKLTVLEEQHPPGGQDNPSDRQA